MVNRDEVGCLMKGHAGGREELEWPLLSPALWATCSAGFPEKTLLSLG